MTITSWTSKKNIITLTSVILALLLIGAGFYLYYIYDSARETVDVTMQDNVNREASERRVSDVELDELEPVSFLLLGTDSEESDSSGRSDTIIVVTVNPIDESLKMLSIPRDTLVDIPGRDEPDKINHAFAFGGSELAMDTVEQFLDIPVDYVIRVNMDGFVEMVDAVGGITVYNERTFDQDGFEFPEGEVSLDGERALAFTRMRQNDPEGDLGRNRRQQQVVMGIIDEGASISSVTRIEDILEGLGNNIRTNLNFDDMATLLFDYRSSRHQMDVLHIEGSGVIIDDIWYLDVSDDEVNRISDVLKDHLDL
ncbi:LCP family glycopolymer transferase [Salisediminibacterium selenitireducens]|uniref:Cell envelope-related transcriptional attenuator n=1 Tax=Bacillus selenitireducens (strain ATCC 700615 / DSM 15326 / MLS10) TaxID=439292 RepID=D6Y0J7_BACIE|nr:LCP family protein [Salisediminibacterium selenitireducens]ADI00565.1 cell envelope-related transcriptional attenuator [[Bacillus] selenitireducens MLS10]